MRTAISHLFQPTRALAAASAAALCLAAVTACGDSSDGDTAAVDAAAGTAAAAGSADGDSGGGAEGPISDADGAAALVQSAIDDTSSEARALVVIDDVSYEFRPLDTDADGERFFAFCTVVAGSLQASMLLVDDAGAPVAGGELEAILIEPGGAYAATGDPAELAVAIPGVIGDFGLLGAETIDAPASGRSAAGTFSTVDFNGQNRVDGTIEISC